MMSVNNHKYQGAFRTSELTCNKHTHFTYSRTLIKPHILRRKAATLVADRKLLECSHYLIYPPAHHTRTSWKLYINAKKIKINQNRVVSQCGRYASAINTQSKQNTIEQNSTTFSYLLINKRVNFLLNVSVIS